MTYHVRGNYYSSCSCNVGCPCTFGELDGDRGWCSGTLCFEFSEGEVDGIDVSDTKMALTADWPRGFLAGGGKGRVYFDLAVSEAQAAVLEPLIQGRLPGGLEGVGMLVDEFLPSQRMPIEIRRTNGDVRASVGDVQEMAFATLRGPDGQPTRVLNAAAAFRDDIVLGKASAATAGRDPDLRQWHSLGHAEYAEVDWEG